MEAILDETHQPFDILISWILPQIRDTLIGCRTDPFVSDANLNRVAAKGGDTIDARGLDLTNYKANPIVLFGHDAGTVANIVGRAKTSASTARA